MHKESDETEGICNNRREESLRTRHLDPCYGTCNLDQIYTNLFLLDDIYKNHEVLLVKRGQLYEL